MALTNILNEPRREITEQTLGFFAIVGFLVLNVSVTYSACWLIDGTVPHSVGDFLLADAVFTALTGIAIGVLVFVHKIGEAVCDWMSGHGRDPRPAQRY